MDIITRKEVDQIKKKRQRKGERKGRKESDYIDKEKKELQKRREKR